MIQTFAPALHSCFKFIVGFFALVIALMNTGCQATYILKNAYYQVKMINEQVDLDEAIKNEKLTDEEKRKILLAKEAKDFAERHIGLKKSKNYTGFIYLDQSHVSYVVSAAEKWKLKPYIWSYPVVGKMPYRGYFREEDAKNAATDYEQQGFDVSLRGVSAYSTLGWFRDPIVSSMLKYKDIHLVDTIIHETVHTTLYIKNNADFNERLAVFIGAKGAEQFYLEREGPDSITLKNLKIEAIDDRLFSEFISKELNALEIWYDQLTEEQKIESVKADRIQAIQKKFAAEILPQMKTQTYKKFPELKLNNARLLIYRTYVEDLSDFEKLFTKVSNDWPKFLEACFQLEKSQDPVLEMKKLVQSMN
ncbi:MAG: aminopeptidase, partial [Pseudobdellovibrionaceae bacterium]